MGIGRRDFLKMFGSALAALSTNASQAIAYLDDYYVNRKLGIAFRRPQGWVFASAKEMGPMKAGLILDLGDPEVERMLISTLEDPILVISKEPISTPSRDFTPAVTIYLENYDEDLEGTHEVAMQDEIAGGRSLFKYYSLLSPPRARIVSNCPAFEYTARFLFEHCDLARPAHVNVRVLSVYHKPALYDIRMYDSPYLGANYTFNYDKFVDGIRLV